MLELVDVRIGTRLAGVSAAIAPGQVTAICGPNGAGKSTMLATLAGLLAPDSGQVLLRGQPVAAMPGRERARAIGYLPQQVPLAWDISVETLIRLGRLPHTAGAAEDARAVAAALAAMALEPFADRPCATLSGGELARAHLARVLAGEPAVVLADEPLASLDLAHQASLLGRLRKLADEGQAVVLVLHDLAAAMNHADRVVVLDRGRVAADGPPAEALSPAVLAAVWQVHGTWLGEPGSRALAVRLPT